MDYKKYRWSKDYEAAEEELERLLSTKAADSKRWELDAYETVGSQQQPAMRRLWCAEGSLKVAIGGAAISLQPGDALDIQPNAEHSLSAGVAGCVCYEATN